MKIEKMRKMLTVLEILVILVMFTNLTSAAINPPTNVKSSLSGTSLTVSWTVATGATQYRVHIYVNSETTQRSALTKYVNGTSVVIQVPSATDCYTAHVRTWLPSQSTNSAISNKVCGVASTPIPTPIQTSTPTPTPTDIPDATPPDNINNLHNTSYAPDHIDWKWTNPTNPDFEQVDIYINGIFKVSITDGIETYTATGLKSDTSYEIGTHTLDISGNVNNTWKNATARTAKLPAELSTIRFITIGDTHITSNITTDQYKRFTRAISYVNNRTDIDFVVQMGDIVDSGSDSTYTVAKSIISKLKVPYYVLEGNHGSGSYFTKYFGKDEHMEYFPDANGYQMIFPAYNSGNWSFNYSKADKNRPTIIFNHGQVQPKPGGISCINDWGSYYSYACSMRSEVDKFTKLLGFYDGHVHSGTHQVINGRLFVTEDNLGGNGAYSDYIGLTVIQNGVVTYTTVRY
ncbi:MAG: metallophosphoesterase [Candidatus Methanoperedens sp.]|nr:metallophosphoesterase [Candidatus Methanoperedens sp.]